MKIWLSGPLDEAYASIPEFEDMAQRLRDLGHEPVLPQDVPAWQHDGYPCPPGPVRHGHAARCFLRTRVPAMMQCDAIMMMPGWADDRMTRAERRMASLSGMVVYANAGSVPRVVNDVRIDHLYVDNAAKIMLQELKTMEYPSNDAPRTTIAQDDGESPVPHLTSVCRSEYERGLAEGEDLFWRKLAGGLVRNGHSEPRAAAAVAALAVAPPGSDPRSDPKMETLARRMYEHGVESLRRKHLTIHSAPDARHMLRQMILFVTGKDVEE